MARPNITMRVVPLLVLWAIAGASPLPAQRGFEADWKRECARTAPPLESLARWAQSVRLFRECILTWDTILLLDPDHAVARGILRYSREGNSGPWVRTRPFKLPRNLKEDGLEEFEKRRRDIVAPFAVAIVASLNANKDTLSPKQRENVLRKLVRIDPDNPEARAAFGAANTGDRWLPEDALLAASRRQDLAKRAKRIRDAIAAPATTTSTEDEDRLDITFLELLRTQNVRVLSNAPGDEGARTARYCEAAPLVFNELMGAAVRHRRGYTVYLLPNSRDKDRFLENHPSLTDATRKFYAKLAGGWVNSFSGLADWAPDPDGRTDYAVRQTIALCFTDAYRITFRQGWIFEGFGLYLTDLICGTKLTYYVKPSPYAVGRDSLREKLMRSQGNWFELGRGLLEGPRKPPLGRVLNLDATSMVDEDMLYAYILAAWLIETRPAKVPGIIRDAAKLNDQGGLAEAPEKLLEKHLGFPITDIERRLMRWLVAITDK